jgi:hypothetical protein
VRVGGDAGEESQAGTRQGELFCRVSTFLVLVLNYMNIIFAFIVFYFPNDLQFKFELSEGYQLSELNVIYIYNTLIIVPILNM